MIELRQLRAFVVIAEEGHITRAAARLGMQQPPLTRLLHGLERDLGVPLMERFPKGVRPTAAGTALLAEARAVLQRAAGINDVVSRAARGEQGKLALGFTSSSALNPFVPSVIRTFRQSVPGVSVVLDEAGTAELVDALMHERLDAAFVRSQLAHTTNLTNLINTPGLRVDTILREPMVVALATDHPMAQASGSPVPLSSLASEAFVLYRRPAGPGLYDALLAACKAAGFSPTVAQEAPRMTATMSLVAAGLGISIVPASMARLRGDGVVYRTLSGCPGLLAPLYLASRITDRSPILARFIDTVVKQATRDDKQMAD
ncbi:LysR family transcriptional regulator [Pigmentiphaga aceris]|uniref:LysR family transcriptional regulator n=1 Tax=Pigmentiphaga aceris TaxID=1940612 RepID=A0A5C0AT04_9BURK|nr:LysR family transcriptional regulator [Pigmentiphaga aceris]QEI04764.1 LysR family transcriptional regulator [Pigmentiphaga aceris]